MVQRNFPKLSRERTVLRKLNEKDKYEFVELKSIEFPYVKPRLKNIL